MPLIVVFDNGLGVSAMHNNVSVINFSATKARFLNIY